MLKFIIIFGLFLYVVYKVGSLFFRAGAASQALRDQERRNFNANNSKSKKSSNKAGEYIDYEEVK